MSFGLEWRRGLTGAAAYVRILQGCSLLPGLYILLAAGYMGIAANADRSFLSTRSAAADGEWAEAVGFPLWGGTVDLRHDGKSKSMLTNRTGRDLTWQAELSNGMKTVLVPDGGTAVCEE